MVCPTVIMSQPYSLSVAATEKLSETLYAMHHSQRGGCLVCTRCPNVDRERHFSFFKPLQLKVFSNQQ